MKLNPQYIYKYVKITSDGSERFGRVCDIGFSDESDDVTELQLSYGSSIYVYKESEIDSIEIIDERNIVEYDTIVLRDGRTASVVDYYGPDLLVDTGSNPKDWDTEVVHREDVVEVIKND